MGTIDIDLDAVRQLGIAYTKGGQWAKWGQPQDSEYNQYWEHSPLWKEWRRGWSDWFNKKGQGA